MKDQSNEEPKLIIDEDWKSQIQREKELLKQKESEGSTDNGTTSSSINPNPSNSNEPPMNEESSISNTASRDEPTDDTEKEMNSPPPASFEFLVSGMATQALAAMGHFPGEDDQQMPVRLDYARHYIELLGVLETKTKGNLSETEARFLQNTLHQLRMLFVSCKK
jgi:Domain of unknown function (DUF1844)